MNKTLRTVLIVLGALVGIAAVITVGFFLFSGIAGGFFRHSMVMEGYHTFQGPGGRLLENRPMLVYSRFGFFGGILARLIGFSLLAAFGALLVWAAMRLFGSRSSSQAQPGAPAAQSVQEILDRRYPHGEISREEYLQILHDTGNPAPVMPEQPVEPDQPDAA